MIRDLFSHHIKPMMSDDAWLIVQDHYDPKCNLQYETVFGLANGYMGTRGAFEESAKISQPTTFINGVFDKSETFMRELANLPNWLGIKLYVQKQLIGIDECEVLQFTRVLDMKHSFLAKSVILRDEEGRETKVEAIRFLSRSNAHMACMKLYVTPLNYSGILEIENIVDGAVMNFEDAPRFKVKHTELVENSAIEDSGTYMEVKTRDFGMHIGVASRVRIYDQQGKDIQNNRQFRAMGETAYEFVDCDVKQNETIVIHKMASYYTERDGAKDTIKPSAINDAKALDLDTIDGEYDRHIAVYEAMWDQADIQINGDFELDRAVRYNIYQLMSTASEHDDRINLGAKLLHGEEYGGHAFWDTELFMLPFFCYVFPSTAKNLVTYRYHLLNAARQNAKDNGYKGAKFPWESADTGEEECPDWTIYPDGSCHPCFVAKYEHHVTAAVAFGAYRYFTITKDMDYFLNQGAEILLETARFWSSRFEYNPSKDHYEINQVTGPDEWHEPVDNNCYTNYLAKWNINLGLKIAKMLKRDYPKKYEVLSAKINLTDQELTDWDAIQQKVYLPVAKEGKLFEQFQGYFDHVDVVIDAYDENDMPIRPEILKTVARKDTQLIKQADVVMLMYLLGEEFDLETQRVNYDYYEKRALHGSSLSPSIYSIMGLRVGNQGMAYRYLKRAAFIDIKNLQGNTREGIHAANAGGVWKVVVFGFAGVSVDKDQRLNIDPNMPNEWEDVTFKIHYQGTAIRIKITKDNEVDVKRLGGEPMDIVVKGKVLHI